MSTLLRSRTRRRCRSCLTVAARDARSSATPYTGRPGPDGGKGSASCNPRLYPVLFHIILSKRVRSVPVSVLPSPSSPPSRSRTFSSQLAGPTPPSCNPRVTFACARCVRHVHPLTPPHPPSAAAPPSRKPLPVTAVCAQTSLTRFPSPPPPPRRRHASPPVCGMQMSSSTCEHHRLQQDAHSNLLRARG